MKEFIDVDDDEREFMLAWNLCVHQSNVRAPPLHLPAYNTTHTLSHVSPSIHFEPTLG